MLPPSLIALCIVWPTTGTNAAFEFLCTSILPAWLLMRELHKVAIVPGIGMFWRPSGHALVALSLYVCFGFIAITLYMYGNGQHTLSVYLEYIKPGILPENQAQLALLPDFALLLIPVLMWMGAAWLCTLFAHFASNSPDNMIRPSIAVTPFVPTRLLPLMLAASLLVGISLPEPLQYIGKISFILLLVPYFALGAAVLQHTLLQKQVHPLLRICIYICFLAWQLAFILALYGIWTHLRMLQQLHVQK